MKNKPKPKSETAIAMYDHCVENCNAAEPERPDAYYLGKFNEYAGIMAFVLKRFGIRKFINDDEDDTV